jgi:nucleotide-binding universal stress UspA family protein
MTEGAGPSPATSGFELGTDGPQVILVGIDGSESSLRAGAYAWGLARRQGSRLVAAWVRPHDPAVDLYAGTGAALMEARLLEGEQLQEAIEWASSYYGIPAASLVVRHGDPFRELSQVAEEERADAVVVGASYHAGHRLVGSLGLRLVRTGRWPVTVVP